ncbi:membrane protein involved in the export of o-antigen and teichoic acid [Leptolyngbya sp. Heron Island J]|uniref:lipopolysaccharide biosynthesis protein n=1 Tax=Leptolyngbya sp. Heron Island J TaxID=1385935 RepID=UPI0003B95790|nr:lipopolysaccharide biosynthesis protein [Leptolyngbya sp. Heron Island J]ESA36799.1 membrane protein involved in the export of o-antigen and teichoic acid [Leptolyngbya sp. Heron Island J]
MRTKIEKLFSDKLVKNIGWQTASQIFTRIIRIATVVVLARNLTTEDYGLMAILFAITDFANVFIQKGGIAPKLIQAHPDELKGLVNTAYWSNWVICIAIFSFQCLIAFPIALFYENDKLILPIIVAGIAYLVNPFYAVQDALIRRDNRLEVGALAGAINAVVTQILLIIFAIMGLGIWSIVLALIAAQASWLTVYRKNYSWKPSGGFTLKGWQDIFNFSKFPLGIEMLNYLRSNIDYLLIGKFFNVEQLGLYFFAFNAGLGISLTAINMVSNSVFPYLCEVRSDLKALKNKYMRSLKICAAIIFPLVLLQSSLAPVYVPIVFGEKWLPAIPILILICLSALPRPFALVSEQLLLAVDRGMVGLKWNVVFTIVFILSIVLASQFSILAVAAVVLGIHLLCLPLFSISVSKAVFSGKKLFSLT